MRFTKTAEVEMLTHASRKSDRNLDWLQDILTRVKNHKRHEGVFSQMVNGSTTFINNYIDSLELGSESQERFQKKLKRSLPVTILFTYDCIFGFEDPGAQ